MLTKQECIDAIINWEITRSKYSRIESLIPSGSVFKFTPENLEWITKNNNSDNFHAYVGINDNNLILIIVPLNNGKEKLDLSFYLTSDLGTLEKELSIIETEVITTTKTTILSKNLAIKKYSEEVEGPGNNEPTIVEAVSVIDIERWKNHYKDWFYCECNDFNGQRIFRSFTVPFSDLNTNNKYDKANEYDEVIASFGFKDSFVCERVIPVLIFIAVNSTTQVSQIIRSSDTDPLSGTNTKDYSQPCPPMCRLENNFALLS
jgi:hypothetical protein